MSHLLVLEAVRTPFQKFYFTIYNIFNKLTHSHRSSASTGPFGLVPQELLDHIVFYLADDRASTLSCALVHPTWTSISRYHLPPLTLVANSPSRANELTKLLRSSRETLSSSITGIMLVGGLPFVDILANARARSYNKLLDVLKAKHVMLRSGVVKNEPSLVRLVAQYFPDLPSLKVICASLQDITSFIRALSGSFPRLAELSIELAPGGMDMPVASLSGLHNLRLTMPCLRTLRVIGWNNDLVRWLGDNVVGTLECLDLEGVWSTCRVEEAIPLLQRNKETLQDLRLYFGKRDVAFDLSSLLRLETLELMAGIGDMEMALNGWQLPRSLKRVYLRDVVCVLVRPSGMRIWIPRLPLT
ncbi:hypothetical protein BDZ89DRAFT_197680 [Hymenopellis radicata]|nr:hypothetical protein BDZ89DRAFT_197680 [Hymenopellis radicata]